MSFEYIEDLANQVDDGNDIYGCPSQHSSKWFISEDLCDLRIKAQRAADVRRYDVNIYRLVNPSETVNTDSYLIVTKIGEPGLRGEANVSWTLVDTKEAAMTLRDVSQGPTPFFGAVLQETFKPQSAERNI